MLTVKQLNAHIRRKVRARATKKPKGPNLNETRFNRLLLAGEGLYEPCHIVLTRKKKRRYTPDFLYRGAYIEVKGDYRLQSEDRARLAFEFAAEANTETPFVWARWAGIGKGYLCEMWYKDEILERYCRTNEEFVAFLAGHAERQDKRKI